MFYKIQILKLVLYLVVVVLKIKKKSFLLT